MKVSTDNDQDESVSMLHEDTARREIIRRIDEFLSSSHGMLVIKRDRNCFIIEVTKKSRVEV